MSEEWIFYPCQMGERSASIFYDHGIRETIDEVAPAQLLKVRVTFKHPRPDGLSSREEFQQLCALEDEMQAIAEKHGGLYVGRVTVGGYRYLHIFASGSEEDWVARFRLIAGRHGYEVRCTLKLDAERAGYWKDLFPGSDDWRVIQDLRVLEALAKHGDNGTESRRVDHWAYFPSLDVAEQFSRWAQGQEYIMAGIDRTDDGRICVRFAHEGGVRLAEITSHTIALWRKSSDLGGSYDGWESPVCKTPG